MTKIERIERYRFNGQEFRDLSEVAKYVENGIGKIIDDTPLRLNPRDALAVLHAIIRNRDALRALLSATYTPEYDDDLQEQDRNVLELCDHYARKDKS